MRPGDLVRVKIGVDLFGGKTVLILDDHVNDVRLRQNFLILVESQTMMMPKVLCEEIR
jgi:hypothetical protein